MFFSLIPQPKKILTNYHSLIQPSSSQTEQVKVLDTVLLAVKANCQDKGLASI